MKLVAFFFGLGPLWFGIGFIAPVVAALFTKAGVAQPLGLTPIQFGVAIGIIVGGIALKRRTWLW